MQVRQAEHMGVVYEHGIGIRHIQPALHYRGGYENVVFALHETEHKVFEFRTFHLPVTYCDARIGNKALYHAGHLEYVFYAIVYEKYLSSARQFVLHGIADGLLIERYHLGIYRMAVRRRGGYYGQIARRHKRKLKRARYRCSGKCERIHIFADSLELVFHSHSELMLLVHYQKTQVFELHVLAYYLMRAYDYIYFPFFEVFEYGGFFLCRAETVKIFHTNRHALEPRRKTPVMLESEYRGRHEHGNLF